MNRYIVRARYIDADVQEKVLKKEKTDITFATSEYRLSITAEDIKKAYDIAQQYLPVGTDITSVEYDYDVRCGTPNPF